MYLNNEKYALSLRHIVPSSNRSSPDPLTFRRFFPDSERSELILQPNFTPPPSPFPPWTTYIIRVIEYLLRSFHRTETVLIRRIFRNFVYFLSRVYDPKTERSTFLKVLIEIFTHRWHGQNWHANKVVIDFDRFCRAK